MGISEEYVYTDSYPAPEMAGGSDAQPLRQANSQLDGGDLAQQGLLHAPAWCADALDNHCCRDQRYIWTGAG